MCHAYNMFGGEAKVGGPSHLTLHPPKAQHQAEGAPVPAASAAEGSTGALPLPHFFWHQARLLQWTYIRHGHTMLSLGRAGFQEPCCAGKGAQAQCLQST